MNSGNIEELGNVWVGGSVTGCSATCSQSTRNFTASAHVVAGAQQLKMKVSCGCCSLFIQLCFKCSFPSKSHPSAFPLKLTLQGIEVSFPGNAGLDGSHPPNEPPWRRLGDSELPMQVSGGCMLNPTDWGMRSWITFSLLSGVSST